MFSWQHARFEYTQDDTPPAPPYHPIAINRLCHELALELLREARVEDLQLLLKSAEHRYPSVEGISASLLKALLPHDKTRQICERIFDGTRIVQQTLSASQLGRPKTVKLLLYLRAASALHMYPDPQLSTVTDETTRERLRSIQLQDHFQRLLLDYAFSPDDLEQAYHQRMATFAPGTMFCRANEASAQQIGILLGEAVQALRQSELRRAYRVDILGRSGVERLRELRSDELAMAQLHGQEARAERLRRLVEDLV